MTQPDISHEAARDGGLFWLGFLLGGVNVATIVLIGIKFWG